MTNRNTVRTRRLSTRAWSRIAINALMLGMIVWLAYGVHRDQPPRLTTTNRGTELQRPTDPSLQKRTWWTIQIMAKQGPAPNINPLWGYGAAEAEGLIVVHSSVEPAAVIRPCTPDPADDRWCAAYAASLNDAARRTAEIAASGETALLGTTYPLPGIVPSERFLSWTTPSPKPASGS